MLLQLRDFIARERLVSTQQLVRAFCIELAALQPMLDRWVAKGVIVAHDQATCRRACQGCRTPPVYYRYAE